MNVDLGIDKMESRYVHVIRTYNLYYHVRRLRVIHSRYVWVSHTDYIDLWRGRQIDAVIVSNVYQTTTLYCFDDVNMYLLWGWKKKAIMISLVTGSIPFPTKAKFFLCSDKHEKLIGDKRLSWKRHCILLVILCADEQLQGSVESVTPIVTGESIRHEP